MALASGDVAERLDDMGNGRVHVRDHRIRLVKGAEVGQGVVNGITVRSELVFDRAEGTSGLGDCSIE